MSNTQQVQESEKNEGVRVWDGEHFGPKGTIAVALHQYELAVYNDSCEIGSDKEIAMASMNYAMTLYSAIGNCVARIKKFKIQYLADLLDVLWCLRKVVSHIVQWKMYEQFDASQKEAFMAYLLVCRWMNPFSFFSYRKMAIKLGDDIISEDNCSHATCLLTLARLSRMWFYKKTKEYREVVVNAIILNEEGKVKQVEDGWIDWKTVNRLARLVGDKEMVKYSAPLANSQDVMIKSGM